LRFDHPLVVSAHLLLRVAALAAIFLLPFSRVFHSDLRYYFERGHSISLTSFPYRDFAWEYPPLSAVPLFLIPLSGRDLLWFGVLFCSMSIAIEYASMLCLQRARPHDAQTIAGAWLLAVLPVAVITWLRLDGISVFFATIALIGLVRGRAVAGPIVAGFAAKLWPIILVIPLLARRRWKDAALALGGAAAVMIAWWMFAGHGFDESFLRFRRAAGFQAESIPGSLLLLSGRVPRWEFGAMYVSDRDWEWVHTAATTCLLVTALTSLGIAWYRRFDAAALTGALLCVAILCNRALSPQYLMWLAPFVIWLWPRHRMPTICFGAATWLSAYIIQRYGSYLAGQWPTVIAGIVRNALLAVLMVELFRVAFRSDTAAAAKR
jgi:hypothetical protein